MFFKIVFCLLLSSTCLYGMDESIVPLETITSPRVVIPDALVPFIALLDLLTQEEQVDVLKNYEENNTVAHLQEAIQLLNKAIEITQSTSSHIPSLNEKKLIWKHMLSKKHSINEWIHICYHIDRLKIEFLKDPCWSYLLQLFLDISSCGDNHELSELTELYTPAMQHELIEMLLEKLPSKMWALFGKEIVSKVINLKSLIMQHVVVTPDSSHAIAIGYDTSSRSPVTIVNLCTMQTINFEVEGLVQDAVCLNDSIALLINSHIVKIFDMSGALKYEVTAQDLGVELFCKIQTFDDTLALLCDSKICVLDSATKSMKILFTDVDHPIGVYLSGNKKYVAVFSCQSHCVKIHDYQTKELIETKEGVFSTILSVDGNSLILLNQHDISLIHMNTLETTKKNPQNKYSWLLGVMPNSDILVSCTRQTCLGYREGNMSVKYTSDHGHLLAIDTGSEKALISDVDVKSIQHAALNNGWVFTCGYSSIVLYNHYTQKKQVVCASGAELLGLCPNKTRLVYHLKTYPTSHFGVLDVADFIATSGITLHEIFERCKPKPKPVKKNEGTCAIS